MNQAQLEKVVVFNGPATEATNATNSGYVDTLGFSQCDIDVILPPATATNSSAKWTTLQIVHSADTNLTNGTAISGMVGTTNATATTAQFVIGAQNNTSEGQVSRFSINLADKERYIHVVGTCPASHFTVMYAARLKGGEALGTTTGMNVGAFAVD